MDTHLSEADPANFDQEMGRLSEVYVVCTKTYFDVMASELEAQQEQQVERNRELLTAFADELTQAGYVP